MKYEEPQWLYEDEASGEKPEEEAYAEQEPQETEPDPEPERSRKADRRGRVIAFSIIGLIVVLAVVFFCMGGPELFSGGSETQTLSERSDPVAFESSGSVKAFGDIVLHIGADGIKAYNISGSQLWDLPYTMSNPSVSTCGGYGAVFDLGGNTILLIDADGKVGSITAESTLLYGTVAGNGYTAVIMENDGGHTLCVYDKDGTAVVRRVTYSDEDGIPLSIAINDDASCMATSYIIYTETTLKSAVTLFNLTDTSSDSIDRIAGNYNYENTLIADLHYFDETLIAVGDNLIAGIDASGNTSEAWTEELSYEITSLCYGDDFLGVLLGDGLVGVSEEAPSDLIILSTDGSHTCEISISEPDYLTAHEGTIIYDDGLDFYAITSDGTTVWSYTADSDMQLIPLGSEFAVGYTGSTLYFYETAATTDEDEIS